MSHSVQCTHCKAVLKSPAPVPAGKKVKCPKCQQPFVTGPAKHDTEIQTTTTIQKPPPLGETTPVATEAPDDIDVPEIDDDLVEPDEDVEVPAKRKKRKADEDDEPRSKKKRKDDEDEDEPRSKKKSKDDDEEDDEPRSKKKTKDDDDEDDEPRSKKKSKDDDEDDEPRSKKKKKKAKAGGSMMIFGLVGGGLLVLLLCVGCGVGGYFFFPGIMPAPDLVGQWEANDIVQDRYEFRADGTGVHDIFFKLNFRYAQSGNKLTVTYTGINIGGGGKVEARDNAVYTVRREGDILYLRGNEKEGERQYKKMR